MTLRFLAIAALISLCASIPLTNDKAARRHRIDRQSFVDSLNARPNMTWRAAINPRFSGLPIGASKDLCGVIRESRQSLLLKAARGRIRFVEKKEGLSIPTSFDSETNWPHCAKVIGDIRDQSNCGCCWAFGAASAASDRMCIASNGSLSFPLSAEDICFCGSVDGCGGGNLETAWNFIRTSGVVSGAQQTGSKPGDDPFDGGGYCKRFSLPHCHHHGPVGDDPYPAENAKGCPATPVSPACPTACDSDAKAPHADFSTDKLSFAGDATFYAKDADTIADAIMSDGPVEAAFSVYSDFENYASGIYQHTSGEMEGGHAIRIVGWGEEGGVKYWKVANSWNRYWGESGYFRIKRGSNECGIEADVYGTSKGSSWGHKGGFCNNNNDEKTCKADIGCHWCSTFCASFPCA